MTGRIRLPRRNPWADPTSATSPRRRSDPIRLVMKRPMRVCLQSRRATFSETFEMSQDLYSTLRAKTVKSVLKPGETRDLCADKKRVAFAPELFSHVPTQFRSLQAVFIFRLARVDTISTRKATLLTQHSAHLAPHAYVLPISTSKYLS